MKRPEDNIGEVNNQKQSNEQGNAESIDRKVSSDRSNVDNGENQVSNGTQSDAPQPGIAMVGNTGPDQEESH